MTDYISASLTEAALVDLAVSFAEASNKAACLFLEGDLGAGKSTFARAWIRQASGELDIPSPTFSLIQEYQHLVSDLSLYHADLYRLNSASDLEELGFSEMLHEGISLVEWASKLPIMFQDLSVPVACFSIEEVADSLRSCTLSTNHPYWQAIAQQVGLQNVSN